jgi:hypothetical protein
MIVLRNFDCCAGFVRLHWSATFHSAPHPQPF